MAGSAIAVTPRPSLTQPLPPVSPGELKLQCEKLVDCRHSSPPMAFLLSHDSSSETAFFFHVSFSFSFSRSDYLTTLKQGCQGARCLIDSRREYRSQHRVKFDFLHVHYCCLEAFNACCETFFFFDGSIIHFNMKCS